jgi:hypothetical protein
MVESALKRYQTYIRESSLGAGFAPNLRLLRPPKSRKVMQGGKHLGAYPAHSILGEACRRGWAIGIAMRSATTVRATASSGWIDGKSVATRTKVGAPVGMDAPIVKLHRPRIGGGLFTFLDDLANEHRRRQSPDSRPRQKQLRRPLRTRRPCLVPQVRGRG